jgi:hypothetical protein
MASVTPKGEVVIYVRTAAVLKARLERAALESGRSLNQEVVKRLERSLDGYRQL